jgi:hypothetical protein
MEPTATSLAAEAPSPTATPRSVTTLIVPVRASITGDGLQVRVGPGTAYEVTASLAEGDEVNVVGRDEMGDWVKVGLDSFRVRRRRGQLESGPGGYTGTHRDPSNGADAHGPAFANGSLRAHSRSSSGAHGDGAHPCTHHRRWPAHEVGPWDRL